MSTAIPASRPAEVAAANRMAAAHIGERTRRRTAKTAARYDKWAVANFQPQVPAADAEAITRWLHAHLDLWGHGTMGVYVDDLRRAQLAAGGADPTGGMVRDYLSAVGRTKGRRTLPRVVALDLAEMARAAERDLHSEQPGGRLLELRGEVAVLLTHALDVPLGQVAGIELDTVTATAAGLHLTVPPHRGIGRTTPASEARTVMLARSGRALDPVAAVEELLELLPAGTTRLLGFGLRRAGGRQTPAATEAGVPQLVSRIRAQLVAAAVRAGLDPASLGDDGCGAGLSDADTGWLLAHLNPSMVRQLRDLTYGLLGTATASRHAGLADLEIRDLEATDTGWDVRFRQEKNNPEGVEELVRVRPVDHEAESRAGCLAWCPACALDRWLLVMRRCWLVEHGLLLPAMHGNRGPSGPLDDWYGTQILRGLLGRDDVSTRSMRAGTITALRAEGADFRAIGDVSGHRSMPQLTRYLRIVDPHSGQYHPPL
ncbi:hypothetical protein SAMN05660748_1066 [Blastococcus aggregatus]|uniref:Phage integrase family protein n=1 Tax=Blastococcus aggregatus TaxID=38502 RepID=A0A285V1N5_9ACTN|nr:hypothetical protein [Blastococcus aggregatus]SOC47837.1 hypothetical protein SAMN05660748_1066 [Blastococcus aggregatus]